MAIVSIVAGVASFVIAPIIAAVVAVITGHMARRQIQQTGEQGAVLALVGLILGYVHLALVGVVIIVTIVIIAAAGTLIATSH